MKTRHRAAVVLMVLLGAMVAITIYFVWPRNHLEIQLYDSKKSADGRWNAVVQMEVYNSGYIVNVAVYAVRLKGADQKEREGDLVLNVPVNYPDPRPSIDWVNGNLVVTLRDHENYQYFVTPVDGVSIVVLRR